MPTIIKNCSEIEKLTVENIDNNGYWDYSESEIDEMHNVHAYPAKFPAFIAEKAIKYAFNEGLTVNTISDVFCGCGTVALEARKHNINFWGCDINPVATLIAKAKSQQYQFNTYNSYRKSINDLITRIEIESDSYKQANDRLKYWFKEEEYLKLLRIKKSIDMIVPNGKYRNAFYCIFSSILKSASVWLTKSIKPQVDPNKKPKDPIKSFCDLSSNFGELVKKQTISYSKIDIETCSFLTKRSLPKVDLIVTSPPYVTSYEYADLHQLSTLWLGYTDDYKSFRKGTIGSAYNNNKNLTSYRLNNIGQALINELQNNQNIATSQVVSVARYFSDMQNVTQKCYNMLNKNGIALFVIGDTEYKGTRIYNSKHLVQSLMESGFKEVSISKRKISNKLLTPYRDENGKFSSDKTSRKIYHEEFIVIAKR